MDIESRAPHSHAAQGPVHGETIALSLNVVREENKLLKEKIRRLITIAPQTRRLTREPSLDVCRGFATTMMIIVKYVGKFVPVVDYSPWDGIHFADFGPPVFLFLAGVSTALATAHGTHRSRLSATGVAFRRSAWLFGLGVLLEGGFLNRENLSFGVDIAEFRVFGTLQRIAVAYFCTSLCEIWASGYRDSQGVFSKKWYLHCAMTALIPAASAAILYGLHVPDWSFPLKSPASATSDILKSNSRPCKRGDLEPASDDLDAMRAFFGSTESASRIILRNTANVTCSGVVTSLSIAGESLTASIRNITYGSGLHLDTSTTRVGKVVCGVRGFFNTEPACNAAAHIDRLVLGMNHMNLVAWYKRLPVCRENLLRYREAPDWCSAPFESEGILSTMSATATSLIGLHFGHAMVRSKQHLARLWSWTLPSASLVIVGMTLHNLGLSFNRQLYSFSYMCFTAGTAGTFLSSVYLLVNATGWTSPFSELLQLIGRHSLFLFALLQCDVLQTLLQGFYHKCPQNNILSYLRNHQQVLHRILPWLRGL